MRGRRKDGPGRRGGEAHVAEWLRVGAKRVLGDVGRGEGSAEHPAGIVVMVVVVEKKGVRKVGGNALAERGRANE